MKIVMVSGFFDPLHDIHLEYFRQAMNWGAFLLVVVASDEQTKAKKGKVNIPESQRREMVSTFLKGMGIRHQVVINYYDQDGSVCEALRYWRPNVFYRGNDKTPDFFPEQERRACEDCCIHVAYGKWDGQRHSSGMVI